MRARSTFAILALTCPLLLVLYALPTGARPFLHFVLAQLCHGVSAGKIAFLLLFCGAVFCRLALASSSAPAPYRRVTLVARLFWLAILAGYAAGAIANASYIRSLQLPWDWPTLHWRDGINSINSLVHTHTSKPAIAWTLSLFGLEDLHTKFDTGHAYLPHVPAWTCAVIAMGFVASCVLGILRAPHIITRYPAPQRAGAGVVYAISCCACVKCVLDGGALAYDALAGALTLALLSRSFTLEELPRTLLRAWAPIVLIAAVWLGVVSSLAPNMIAGQARDFVYRLLIHTLILLVGYLASSPSPRLQPLALTTTSLFACAVFAHDEARSWLLPLLRPAPAMAIVHEARAPRRVPIDGTPSYASAYRSLGENPGRVRRVSFPSQSQTGMLAEVVLTGQGTLPAIETSRVSILRTRPSERPNGYYVDIRFHAPAPAIYPGDRPLTCIDEGERYVAYHLLDRAMRDAGLRDYSLILYVTYEGESPTLTPTELQGQRSPQ